MLCRRVASEDRFRKPWRIGDHVSADRDAVSDRKDPGLCKVLPFGFPAIREESPYQRIPLCKCLGLDTMEQRINLTIYK